MGCGDDDSDDAATDDPRTDAQIAEDQAAADAAVLVLDDLSPDFTAEPRDEDDDDIDLQNELADCLGIPRVLLYGAETRAESDTFVLGDAEVEHNITIQPTVEDATTAIEAVTATDAAAPASRRASRVARGSVREPGEGEEPPEGLEIGDVTVEPVPVDVGEQSGGFRATVPISVEDQSAEVYIDLVAIRVGRSTSLLTFENVVDRFDDELAVEISTLAAGKAPAA